MTLTATHHALPPFFSQLITYGCISETAVKCAPDGIAIITTSVADLLLTRGITEFPNDQNEMRRCDRFFDDWYIYAVADGADYVYSLYKMREQEFDASDNGDGDDPGVTVSFIALQDAVISACLLSPTFENRKALNREINRMVSVGGQTHHPTLKAYFRRPEAEGSYLIAEQYTAFISSLAQNGRIDVPVKYAELHQTPRRKDRRLLHFIDCNNEAAGTTVCNHKHIFLQDPQQLTIYEKQAILATHTANTSFHSFAAEVRFHALFLTSLAKLPLPFIGHSAYDSAIRADLSIDDTEFQGPTPYYRENSRMILRQKNCHPTY